MKWPILTLLTFCLSTLAAQEIKLKPGDTITTPSGMIITLRAQGKGEVARKGDKIKVHYKGLLVDSLKFDSSYDRNQPFEFTLGMKQVIAGWDEAFSLMRKGDRATLVIPPDLAYGDQRKGSIPPGAVLVFHVELLDIQRDAIPKPYKIKAKKMETTPSGLQIGFVERGKGQMAEKGKTVEVHYTGYLEDGDVFDSSILRGQPIQFKLGIGLVIAGWDEAVAMMREGDKAKIIVPYKLAYGEEGRPPKIPAKANLIFNVDLISVK